MKWKNQKKKVFHELKETKEKFSHELRETKEHLFHQLKEVKEDISRELRHEIKEVKEAVFHELKEEKERVSHELKKELKEAKEEVSHKLREELRKTKEEVIHKLKETKEEVFHVVKHELRETKEELWHELKETRREVFELKEKLNERTRPIRNTEKMPRSCKDLWHTGNLMNGFYMIASQESVKSVYCEFKKRREEGDDEDLQAKDYEGNEFKQRDIGYVDIKTKPVYFYVSRYSDYSTKHKAIPFQKEITNRGNFMDLDKGIFTAPVSGKYFFGFTGMAKMKTKHHEHVKIKLAMYLNNEKEVAKSYYDAPPKSGGGGLEVATQPTVDSNANSAVSTPVEATTMEPDITAMEPDITTLQPDVNSKQLEDISRDQDDYARITNSFEVTLKLKKGDRISIKIEDIENYRSAMEYVLLSGFLLEEDIHREDYEDFV